MKVIGIEFFEDLLSIHEDQSKIKDKYPKMRSLLERVCKNLTANENIQFSNLFSRLNYVCEKTNLDRSKTFQINTLRINANKVLHSDFKPSNEDYLQNLKALCNAISHFYAVKIPESIDSILPKNNTYRPKQRQEKKHDRIRVEVSSTDQHFIYGFDEENPTEDPIKIKHHVSGINDSFNETITRLWKGCQLNLIDVTIDETGAYLPDLIILEPDYLVDISSLAECMKEYGKHPLNYIQSKLEPLKNTKHILLGNIANLFLDEFVNEKPLDPVIYNHSIKKAFKSAPFEFSTCEELDSNFFQDTQTQFQNIKNVVNNVFPAKHIDREKAILEPSFICEHLGVQGRLDFLQLGSTDALKFVIELKSGKAPFPETNFELIGLNHRSQAFIYQIIIQKILGIPFKNLSTFILYSKYTDNAANLRLSTPYMAAIKEILNIRNLIIANEKEIATDSTDTKSKNIIKDISPANLITNTNLRQNFLDNFIIPQINNFKACFLNSKPLELEYFHSFYAFVTKEHYISKAGDVESNSAKGISSLWLSSIEEKYEAGEILTDLSIVENQSETEDPIIKLKIPKYEHSWLPNFRQGDIVILYERNSEKDNVTNKQIFKGSLSDLRTDEISIRLRFKQRNQSVLPKTSKYAIEHDFLDSSYNTMYRGLYSFLNANQDRKDLLLCQRQPTRDLTQSLKNHQPSPEISDIILKAKQAKDYFLLVGPPGTGKTSIALRSMVEEFYSDSDNNILLLSYTNRAVDEICDALNKMKDNPNYIRIGSELSCDIKHRKRLLEHVITNCENRIQVKQEIEKYRIFVGTVASVSNKSELFKLKNFQIAIIDEASQILEPSILGILCAKGATGGNAIGKFILIGDHKQLPAVVLQSEANSKVKNGLLQQVGLTDRRNSLFERLYYNHRGNKQSGFWAMLHEQWRMHPDISLFPNYSFYNKELIDGSATHQTEDKLNFKEAKTNIQRLIANKRISFIQSENHKLDKTSKTNIYEAKIVSELVKSIYELYQSSGIQFSANEIIGVITPYRNQIALIKKEIYELNIPELNSISVDTVERYQGSQRDIIIYSFCVNQFHQLDFLSNSIEDNGQTIDRKLNVAITRARKQLFIIGNPTILSNNLTYYRFIEFIRSKSGMINVQPEEFIKGNFSLNDPDINTELEKKMHEPDSKFSSVYENLVIQSLKADKRSQYPNILLGFDHDYIRLNVIEFGRAKFDQNTLEHSSEDKVNLYCFYNMRKHYFSSLAVFDGFKDYISSLFRNSGNRITFIDFGCGPLTSGLAFNDNFKSISNFHFDYIGIDVSNSMLKKAKAFAASGLFNKDTKFQFANSLNEIDENYWQSVFTLSNTVVLNFSYLFGNLSKDDSEKFASMINNLIDKYPLNKYILVYQNSAIEKRNRSYLIFRKLVPKLANITPAKTETITYKNSILSSFDKTETVYYELLSN